MGLFDKLFGTKEMAEAGSAVIGKAVDSIGGAVDRFIFTKEEREAASQAEREQNFRFARYDKEYFLKVLENDLKFNQIDALDRSNARELAKVEIGQDDVFIRRFRYYYALGLSVSAISYIGFITFGTIPKDNQRFADVILGFILSGILGTVISFFFGTTHSSALKDSTINDLTMKK